MNTGQFDDSLVRHVLALATLIWSNIAMFLVVSGAVFAVLMTALLLIQPKYDGVALLIFGRPVEEGSSSTIQRMPEKGASLARIAESDEVINAAIAKVGLEVLTLSNPTASDSTFVTMRRWIFGDGPPTVAPINAASYGVRSAISVRAEPSTDVLRISFRHKNPVIASAFANAMAGALIDRYLELYSRDGATEFFSRQKQRFDDAFREASSALNDFAHRTQTYAAEDQRRLLLQRRSDLLNSVAASRSLIAQKSSERQALVDQLKQLAPVTRSSYLSSLVTELGDDKSRETASAAKNGTARSNPDFSSNPPLLMIRVYQETMVNLFKLNAELAGALATQQQQENEAAHLTEELNTLSGNEREFLLRRRALDQAAANSDLYSRRMVEEQINSELSAAKISSLRILQSATVPVRAVFPNYQLASAGAAALAVLIAFLSCLAFRRREAGGTEGPAQPATRRSIALEPAFDLRQHIHTP